MQNNFFVLNLHFFSIFGKQCDCDFLLFHLWNRAWKINEPCRQTSKYDTAKIFQSYMILHSGLKPDTNSVFSINTDLLMYINMIFSQKNKPYSSVQLTYIFSYNPLEVWIHLELYSFIETRFSKTVEFGNLVVFHRHMQTTNTRRGLVEIWK